MFKITRGTGIDHGLYAGHGIRVRRNCPDSLLDRRGPGTLGRGADKRQLEWIWCAQRYGQSLTRL
jgi:hypothetical protein